MQSLAPRSSLLWVGVLLSAVATGCIGDIGDEIVSGSDATPGAPDAGVPDLVASLTDGAAPFADSAAPNAPADGQVAADGRVLADGQVAVIVDAQVPVDADPPAGETGETGRLVGMTAAHNATRAAVTDAAPLPPLEWSPEIAAFAQEWADTLARTACGSPRHRDGAQLNARGYGENLASFGASGSGNASTAAQAARGWAAEKSCWTYGTIGGSERCDATCVRGLNSDGCGHYTQLVWRKTQQLGCGVASCKQGQFNTDIWICNYAAAGNYRGQAPY